MSSETSHKLKKGETVDMLAKSHKLSVDEIWKYGPNVGLVRKRRTADKCEAGDVIELPMNKADKQAAIAKVEGVLKGLKARSDYIGVAEKRMDDLLAELESGHKKWVADIQGLEKKVEFQGNVADITALFAGSAIMVKGVLSKSKQIAGLVAGTETAETSAKIASFTKDIKITTIEYFIHPLSSPGYSAGSTVLAEGKTSDNKFLSGIGTAADWFGQLTSPSGWAQFITGCNDNLKKALDEVNDNYWKMKSQLVRKKEAYRQENKSVQDMIRVLTPAYQNMKKG